VVIVSIIILDKGGNLYFFLKKYKFLIKYFMAKKYFGKL